MKQAVYRMLNRVAAIGGLQISIRRYDTDSFFITKKYEDLLLKTIADEMDAFLHEQKVIELDSSLGTFDLVREFYDLYRSNPNKYHPGSCGFNVLLSLFLTTRHLKPTFIIESGVFIG